MSLVFGLRGLDVMSCVHVNTLGRGKRVWIRSDTVIN